MRNTEVLSLREPQESRRVRLHSVKDTYSLLPLTYYFKYAGVAELADALALGASAYACRFKSCHPHQSLVFIWQGTFLFIRLLTKIPYFS